LNLTTPNLLAARSVTRRFGRRVAVDGVEFSLAAGECLALFGPNGAGKTTLLRVLGGLLKPDGGEVTLSGLAVTENMSRARIGIISHRTMLYPALTALENVEFTARLYGVGDPREAARMALQRVGLEQVNGPVRMLSRGMQQRVSIARAIVNSPVLLLADEPYTGLDEAGAQALTAVLSKLKNDGAALVLVTHQLNEGLEIADNVAVMVSGAFARYESSHGVDRAEYASQYRDMVTAHA
jgi:heme exporter protein A